MILIYIIAFLVVVSIYAIVTHRLNERAKCDHVWEDKGDEGIECTKCSKTLKISYKDEQVTA